MATIAPWPAKRQAVTSTTDTPTPSKTEQPSQDLLAGLPVRNAGAARDAWASAAPRIALSIATQTADAGLLACTVLRALDGTTADGHALNTEERQAIVMGATLRACQLLESMPRPQDHVPLNAMLAACLDRVGTMVPADACRLMIALLENHKLPVPYGVRSVRAGQDRLAARLLIRLEQAVSTGSSDVIAAIAKNPLRMARAIDVASQQLHPDKVCNAFRPGEQNLLEALADAGGAHPSIEAGLRLSALLPLTPHLRGAAARTVATMVAPLVDVARYGPLRPQHMHYLRLLLGRLHGGGVRALVQSMASYAAKRPEDGSPGDGVDEIRRLREFLVAESISLQNSDAFAVEYFLQRAEAQLRLTEPSPAMKHPASDRAAAAEYAAALDAWRQSISVGALESPVDSAATVEATAIVDTTPPVDAAAPVVARSRKQANPTKLEIKAPSP